MTNANLMASVEAAKNASEKAIRDLAKAHGAMHQEYKQLGKRIGMLWGLPLPRQMQLDLLLKGVDLQGVKVPIGLSWHQLFAGFLKPQGHRANGQNGVDQGADQNPMRLADLQDLQSGHARPLVALERLLVSQNDPMGSMRAAGDLPAGWGVQQSGGKPSFLGLFDGSWSRTISQNEATALLCFFVGDAIKAKMREWFDRYVPQDWPQQPEGVSDADWALSVDERAEAIDECNGKRAELLAQMREIDQQIYKLAPMHDLGKAAYARAITNDQSY